MKEKEKDFTILENTWKSGKITYEVHNNYTGATWGGWENIEKAESEINKIRDMDRVTSTKEIEY